MTAANYNCKFHVFTLNPKFAVIAYSTSNCHADNAETYAIVIVYRSKISSFAHERHRGQSLRTVVEFAMAIAEMLNLEAVGLVLFVIECVEFVDGDLVELVEVGPPLPAAAEVVVEEGVRTLLAQLRRHVERAHRKDVHADRKSVV